MKKKFEIPQLVVISFADEDVIMTSAGQAQPGDMSPVIGEEEGND